MSKTNTTAYIILGLLEHEDMSGYDIKKRIDGKISYFWEVGYGQIYPTLKTLEEEAKIFRKSAESTKGPEKHLYSITEKGKEALQEWLLLPEAKEYTRYEILLKLFFGSIVPAEVNIERIRLFEERHTENLEMMRLFRGSLEQVLSENKDHLHYYLTVCLGEEIYEAYVRWAQKASEMLQKSEENEQK